MLKKYFGKNAQMGETVTWVVATVIIIVILIVTVFFANSGFSGDKKVDPYRVTDTLASKSFFSYLLTNDPQGDIVYGQLQKDENFTDFNGGLAKGIFEEYYGREYEYVWVGFINDRPFFPYEKNDVFGSRPDESAGGLGAKVLIRHVTERINLNEDKYVELALKVIY